MSTDRQKTCKCGINVADFINEIRILEGNLNEVTIENFSTYASAFKSSMNSIFTGINNIEENCSIDARDAKNSSLVTHDRVDQLAFIKNSTKFNGKKVDIFTDLGRIRYGVIEKVRDCSK